MGLYYTRNDRTEHGYTTTYIRVWDRLTPLPAVEAQIEGCTDNKAGYGTPEAATRMCERYTFVRDAGYARADQSMVHGGGYVEVAFQHFKSADYPSKHYCEARYDMGSRLREIESGLKLARRLYSAERKLFPDCYRMEDPDRLVAVLRHLRAKELAIVDCHGGWLYCQL